MPEGIPDELWTNYATFFWDNSTGLYVGAALFGLGILTLVFTGIVSLCKRITRDRSGETNVPNKPRASINNPLYRADREEGTSRQQLVGAQADINDDESLNEEVKEEATVIYENEQFFQAARRPKTTDTEDTVETEDRRNLQPKFAYSQVIKKSNERARKKKENAGTSGSDERGKDRKRDVYSKVIKKTDLETAKNNSTSKGNTNDNPEVPQNEFNETKASREDKADDKSSVKDQDIHTDDPEVKDHDSVVTGHRQRLKDGAEDEIKGPRDENADDYINVTAPRIPSFGDEVYMDMSQKESLDYINCTKISKPK
ncbi:uncharacterized protein LOC132560317 [Ylistrum balloti]|uniref:uncharacterized protein LOC132560317 n=1 Tax=Ylistrum balloti TaxID=509963 RepID=UPI002905B303|nr:uncharacterized protein LOC132560317 [Ylistrum balloti]